MSSRSMVLLLGGALCGGPAVAHAGPDYHVLATFDGVSNGSAPEATLSFDQDGNLYGTTAGYIPNGGHTPGPGFLTYGSVFELSGYNHRQLETLYAFDGVDGRQPVGGVTLDKVGNIFGQTFYRGAGPGFVFKLSGPGRQTITDIHDFTVDEGYSVNSLTFVAAGQPFSSNQPSLSGELLGNSFAGNDGGDGFLFKLAGPGHDTFVHVVDLGTSDPDFTDSFGSLLPDAFGNLFFTKDHFAGLNNTITSVVELSGSDHKTTTTLATLDPATTGSGTTGSALAFDRFGNLYGVTGAGGPLNGGTVFELSGPGHHHMTALAAFDPDGTSGQPSQPVGPLLVDYAGNIFGLTTSGGNPSITVGNVTYNPGGLIYKISADHKTFSTLYKFDCLVDGCAPQAGLVADRSGNIYGTNAGGGTYLTGTVFKLSNAGFVTFPH